MNIPSTGFPDGSTIAAMPGKLDLSGPTYLPPGRFFGKTRTQWVAFFNCYNLDISNDPAESQALTESTLSKLFLGADDRRSHRVVDVRFNKYTGSLGKVVVVPISAIAAGSRYSYDENKLLVAATEVNTGNAQSGHYYFDKNAFFHFNARLNDDLHNERGPALINYSDDPEPSVEYWIKGKLLTAQQFSARPEAAIARRLHHAVSRIVMVAGSVNV